MKQKIVRIVAGLAVMSTVFVGCGQQSANANLENEVKLLREENEKLKAQIVAMEEAIAKAGETSSQSEKGSDVKSENEIVGVPNAVLYETYPHTQEIVFNSSGHGHVLHKEMDLESDTVYELKKGDKILISEATYIEKADDTNNMWVKVLANDEIEGFINMGEVRNPFGDGQWRLLEVIDDTYEVMNFKDKVFVSYGAELKEKPGHENATVHTFEKGVDDGYYDVVALTKDKYPNERTGWKYHWVKINFKGHELWTYGSDCSKDKGGPTFNTPNDFFDWELRDKNEI